MPKGRYSGHSIPTDMVNTPCSGRHGKGEGGGGGAFRASIVEGEAKSAAGAMKVIEIL